MDTEADARAATVAECVRTWVREDFGVELTALKSVAHGDATAELWRGTSVDGARYAIKWTRGGTPAGLLVSAQLAERGVPESRRRCPVVQKSRGASAGVGACRCSHGCRTTTP